MKQNINEIKRMQLIAGLITESEYQKSLVKIIAKEGKNYKFNIGDKLQTYGGEEAVTVVGIQPHLNAALHDPKNPLAVAYLKKAIRQDLVDREEQADQPWYLVKFEDGLPDTDLRYWAENELENMSTDSVPKEKVEEFIWYDAEEGTDLEYMNIMNSFLDKLLAGSKEVTRKQFYQLIDYGYDQPGHGPIGHGADPNTDELFNDLLDN